MNRSRPNAAFTLIELLIVVSIIAILAGIAIPSLLAARSTANDKTVVATLRSIVTAQQLARTQAFIDTDRDGSGEAATLAELAGDSAIRGGASSTRTPYLSASLGSVDADGHVLTHGYLFALYLPDSNGNGVLGTPSNFGVVDSNLAENYWTCVAWPVTRGNSGFSTYFINQNGDIVTSKDAPYSGKGSVPPPGCALTGVAPTAINSSTLAISAVGADGYHWVAVN